MANLVLQRSIGTRASLTSRETHQLAVFFVVVAELLPVHMYPMKMITVNAFFTNAVQVENVWATRCVPVRSPVV